MEGLYYEYLRDEIDYHELTPSVLQELQTLAIEGFLDIDSEFNEEGAAYAAPQFIYL